MVRATAGAHGRLLEERGGPAWSCGCRGPATAGCARGRPSTNCAVSVATPERWPRKLSAVRSAVRIGRSRPVTSSTVSPADSSVAVGRVPRELERRGRRAGRPRWRSPGRPARRRGGPAARRAQSPPAAPARPSGRRRDRGPRPGPAPRPRRPPARYASSGLARRSPATRTSRRDVPVDESAPPPGSVSGYSRRRWAPRLSVRAARRDEQRVGQLEQVGQLSGPRPTPPGPPAARPSRRRRRRRRRATRRCGRRRRPGSWPAAAMSRSLVTSGPVSRPAPRADRGGRRSTPGAPDAVDAARAPSDGAQRAARLGPLRARAGCARPGGRRRPCPRAASWRPAGWPRAPRCRPPRPPPTGRAARWRPTGR